MKIISKKTFVEALKALKEQIDHDLKVSNAFQSLFIDAGNMIPDNERLIYNIIKLLNEGIGDTIPDEYGNTWTSWFVYETDFGRKNSIVQLNGEKHKISNPEELYDIIVEYNKTVV